MKSQLALAMGIIILIADAYWTETSYTYPPWLALGVIIFVADIIWLAIEFGFMRSASREKQIGRETRSSAAAQ